MVRGPRRAGGFSTTSTSNQATQTPEDPINATKEEIPNTGKRPMTFGRFFLYSTGAISGATFLYYFVKSGYSLHKTEIAIGQKLAKLPFYWPPGPGVAETNTIMPQVELSSTLVDQISAWFIYQDTVLKEGVRRNDVLELFGELGLVDPEKEGVDSFQSVGSEEFRKEVAKVAQTFIEKGRGRLSEYKRQSGVSLQEAVKLLDELITLHSTINPSITEPVNSKINELLGRLVESQAAQMTGVPGMALSGVPRTAEPLTEVDASEKDLLEMELSQLERTRANLTSKPSLSDAEKARMNHVDTQIREIKSLLRRMQSE